MKSRLRVGMVIRAPEAGGIWIVSKINDFGSNPTVEAISFDTDNCSAVQSLIDCKIRKTCDCEDVELCKICKGTGSYLKKTVGWDQSKILALSAKDYIKRAINLALSSL